MGYRPGNSEEYWRENALKHIMPPRDGQEFPEGTAAIDKLLELTERQLVLEIGCGRGRLAALYPPERYIGVDISPPALSAAREALPLHTFMLLSDYDKLRGQVDVALMYTVAQHIPDEPLVKLLSKYVLAADSLLIAQIMDSSRGQVVKLPYNIGRDLDRVVELAEQAGWKFDSSVAVPYDAYTDTVITFASFK